MSNSTETMDTAWPVPGGTRWFAPSNGTSGMNMIKVFIRAAHPDERSEVGVRRRQT
jgi:hypothetical protein